MLPVSSRRALKGCMRSSTATELSETIEDIHESTPDVDVTDKITWNGIYDLASISKSFTLPILVRAMEGHYGNSDLSTFSALDVLKIHKGVTVDLVLAKFERTGKARQDSQDDLTVDMDDRPVQICFPKDFCGLFQVSLTFEVMKHIPFSAFVSYNL